MSVIRFLNTYLLEHEVHGKDETDEGNEVIPMEALSLKEETCNEGEDNQRDSFLNDFQLYQREGTSIARKANAVGWYGKAVFDESNTPREGDDCDEWPMVAHACLLQTKMTVPGEGHEDVAGQQQKNGLKGLHYVRINELTDEWICEFCRFVV